MPTEDFSFNGGGAGGGVFDYIRLSDTQTSGTAGTTYTAGAYRTMVLNTEEQDAGGHCSLSSNQFTLAAGTYAFKFIPPLQVSANARLSLRIRNVTDAVTLIKSGIFNQTSQASRYPILPEMSAWGGRFVIAASKALEIQVNADATFNGVALSDGESEVYQVLELWKVA